MYCRNCGTKNDLNDKFCKNCGTKLATEKQSYNTNLEKSKTKNPFLIIIGLFLLVAILYGGREIPKKLAATKINTVSYSGYNLKVPATYKTNIENDVLQITADYFEKKESIGIQLYQDSYNNVLKNFKQLQDTNQIITDLKKETYENEEFIVASYKLKEYQGIIAIKEATNNEVFWTQTMTTTYDRGKVLIKEAIPIVMSANKNSDSLEENS